MHFKRQFRVALFLYKDLKQNYKRTKAFVLVILVVSVAAFRSTQKSLTAHPEVGLCSVLRENITKGGGGTLSPVPFLFSTMGHSPIPYVLPLITQDQTTTDGVL